MVFLENRQISLQNTCRSGQYESAIYIFSNRINTYQLHIAIILLYLWNTLRIIAQSALTIRLDSDLKMQFDKSLRRIRYEHQHGVKHLCAPVVRFMITK